MLFLALYYVTFLCGHKHIFRKISKRKFVHKKLKKSPQKVAYLQQLGGFFLCSPDCPKQPRTSYPFYKFFYPILSPKVSDQNFETFRIQVNALPISKKSFRRFLKYKYQIRLTVFLVYNIISWYLKDNKRKELYSPYLPGL